MLNGSGHMITLEGSWDFVAVPCFGCGLCFRDLHLLLSFQTEWSNASAFLGLPLKHRKVNSTPETQTLNRLIVHP